MKLIEKKDSWVVEGEAECRSCHGTGLYVGIAEKDGAAVVCIHCKGKGCITNESEFKKFDGRKKRTDIKRVYLDGGGYVITPKDIEVKNSDGTKSLVKFSEAGVSYDEWLNGAEPEPIKDLLCPYLHTHQGLQNNDVNDLYKTRCNKGLSCGYIYDCKFYKNKDECWDIYEGADLEKYEG